MKKIYLSWLVCIFASAVLVADSLDDLEPESIGPGAGGVDQNGQRIPWSPGTEASGFVYPNGDLWSGPVIAGNEMVDGVQPWYRNGPGEFIPNGPGVGTGGLEDGSGFLGGSGESDFFSNGGTDNPGDVFSGPGFFGGPDGFGSSVLSEITNSLRPNVSFDIDLPNFETPALPSNFGLPDSSMGFSDQPENIRPQTSEGSPRRIASPYDHNRDLSISSLQLNDPLGLETRASRSQAEAGNPRQNGEDNPGRKDAKEAQEPRDPTPFQLDIFSDDKLNLEIPINFALDPQLDERVERSIELSNAFDSSQQKSQRLRQEILQADHLNSKDRRVGTSYLDGSDALRELSKNTLREGDLDSAEEIFETSETLTDAAASIAIHGTIGMIPVLGDLVDIAEAVSGLDLVTGEELSMAERAVTLVGLVVGSGAVLRAAYKSSRKEMRSAGNIAQRSKKLGKLPGSNQFPSPKLKRQAQGKHTPGSHNYKETNSVWNNDALDPQEAINMKMGTGRKEFTRSGDWSRKEFVEFDKDIGFYVKPKTLERVPTNKAKIHYANDGAHIVPLHPKTRL